MTVGRVNRILVIIRSDRTDRIRAASRVMSIRRICGGVRGGVDINEGTYWRNLPDVQNLTDIIAGRLVDITFQNSEDWKLIIQPLCATDPPNPVLTIPFIEEIILAIRGVPNTIVQQSTAAGVCDNMQANDATLLGWIEQIRATSFDFTASNGMMNTWQTKFVQVV
jgi:hypothetical protein